MAHLECKLYNQVPSGDHTLFVGEVLAAYVTKSMFNQTYNLEKTDLIYHIGGKHFAKINKKVIIPEV
jgi:flavin reductase (DIM6/NTAB) family NADH-FMN oxidoreductase RutF